jgi:hypothetical protein
MGGRRHPLTKWGKPIPQRFPHKSGADLGDNWISGFSDRHPGGYEGYEEDLHRELEDHMVMCLFSPSPPSLPPSLSLCLSVCLPVRLSIFRLHLCLVSVSVHIHHHEELTRR